jgi:hypothetical protein
MTPLPAHKALLFACVLATGLGACAHSSSGTVDSPATSSVTRRSQAPRFIHRRTFVEGGLKAATEGCDPLCQKYSAAVAATKYPTPSAISVGLTAIVHSTPGLVWKEGKILMATWTELKWFHFQPGQTFNLDGDTWWTVVPVMKEWCQSTGLRGNALRLRIAQRLGMPPDASNDGFVEIWVDPEDIFRPCPDPEAQDHECLVQEPMIPPYHVIPDEPPWACSGLQMNAEFVQVQDSHLQWMCNNWKSSYLNSNPLRNYPWTALGYTYDWGSDSSNVGPSEFVSLDGVQVIFNGGTKTDEYCAPPP